MQINFEFDFRYLYTHSSNNLYVFRNKKFRSLYYSFVKKTWQGAFNENDSDEEIVNLLYLLIKTALFLVGVAHERQSYVVNVSQSFIFVRHVMLANQSVLNFTNIARRLRWRALSTHTALGGLWWDTIYIHYKKSFKIFYWVRLFQEYNYPEF